NSRETEKFNCTWGLILGKSGISGGQFGVTVATGEGEFIPLKFELPANCAAGEYEINADVTFKTGEAQKDSFAIHVLPAATKVKTDAKIALFDPLGETRELLTAIGVPFKVVKADADLSGFDALIVGKEALT